jgi:hypothetical protein
MGVNAGRAIAALSGQENVIVIRRPFVEWLGGNVEAAIILDQCLYWSSTRVAEENDGWFHRADEEWAAEFFMSTYKLREARKLLTKMGLVEAARRGIPARMHYFCDADNVAERFSEWLAKSEGQSDETEEPVLRNRKTGTPDSQDILHTKMIEDTPQDGDGDGDGFDHDALVAQFAGLAQPITKEEVLKKCENLFKAQFLSKPARGTLEMFAEYIWGCIDHGEDWFDIEADWHQFHEKVRENGESQYVTPRNVGARFKDHRASGVSRKSALKGNPEIDRLKKEGWVSWDDDAGKWRMRPQAQLAQRGLIEDHLDPINRDGWGEGYQRAAATLAKITGEQF